MATSVRPPASGSTVNTLAQEPFNSLGIGQPDSGLQTTDQLLESILRTERRMCAVMELLLIQMSDGEQDDLDIDAMVQSRSPEGDDSGDDPLDPGGDSTEEAQ